MPHPETRFQKDGGFHLGFSLSAGSFTPGEQATARAALCKDPYGKELKSPAESQLVCQQPREKAQSRAHSPSQALR